MAQVSWAQSSEFAGREAIEQNIADRLLDGKAFTFSRYFIDIKNNGALLKLLGYYDSANGPSLFVNGNPNSVNMLLYALVLNSLADEIQASCLNPGALPLKL